ncbi:uncharacterized protein LOC100680226 [Nasonia vitripennis]|uniref:Uncharacterized protein n=1 Tax=Nasonia vitripennis TaxID=7425 RepID=A0A7M7Q7E8_NASVI|nr:uncharacterized protein LOC100680226 [Nasonia vitripennis]XP_031782843.1 uncharacterized protein LOC100680226 [Nasonia vitripennis]XP_031782844.1 uncharacterized protein LOC100680226 [Nasonia vitripennis]
MFSLDNPTKVDTGFSFRSISPSAFTHKPEDVTKNPGCQLTVDKPALFQFGNSQRDAEKKFEKKFNFVLNVEKSDESGSGADNNITSIKETESKSIVKEETINEDTNKKFTTQMQDKESSEQEQKSDEGNEKTDEISVKVLFKEFKEIINEFSKERAEYEKRITALEARIEALETSRRLQLDNISSTGKGDEGHDTVPINCAKDMPFAIQSLPVAVPSFISPQATIFGSTLLYSSATAPTPNYVFEATSFPSKSASSAELLIPKRQLNNSPFSLSTPMVQTNLLSSTENTISEEMKNKGKENNTSLANKGNEVINTSLRVNKGLEKKKQRTSEAPYHLEHQTNESTERIPSLDNFKKSIEESFQKAMRDIFTELKETLESVYDKKN